jgi:E3 ubiquitin-protein transferase RMND5
MLKTIIDQASDIHNASTFKIQEIIKQVENEVNEAIEATQSSEAGTDYAAILKSLKVRINNLVQQSQMELYNNEIEASFGTYLTFFSLSYTDILKAYMQNKPLEPQVINQVVANYLFRHNNFEFGDAFIRDAGVPEALTFRSKYKEMHEILQSLQKHDICPAIDWIYYNKHHPELSDPRFQFELYRQQYLEVLKSGTDQIEVLNFLRTYITPFDKYFGKEVKSLAGCILWIGQLDESPYADLLSSATWDKVANDFTEKFLGLIRKSAKCLLTTMCSVSAQYLCQLLSLREIAEYKEQWESIQSLPFNQTDGGEKSNFHSVFVSQACRETVTVDKPPILLPCGHTLSWDTVSQLSWAGLILFRCPLCSYLTHWNQCQKLYI